MDAPLSKPRCLRCGYDLRGLIASWSNSCPMEAACSECGHGFALFDVFYPQVNDQRGFVEHSRGARAFIGRSLRTWVWALVPNWFWRRVVINQRIDLRRMLLWPLVIVLGLHLVNIAAGMGLVLLEQQNGLPHGLAAYLSMLTWPVLVMADLTGAWNFQWTAWEQETGIYVLVILSFHLTWPMMLTVLAESRRQAKIRRGHLARGVVYGLSWLMLLPLMRLGIVVVDAADLALNGFAGRRMWAGWGVFSSALHIPWREQIEPLFTIWSFGAFVWLTWWWWSAIIQGWRFHRGWLVCVLLTIIAALVTALVAITPLLLA